MPSSKLIRTRIAASFFRPRTGVCIHSPAQITPVAGSWQASVAFNAQQPSRKLADVRDDNISLVGSSIKPALSPRTVQEPTDSNHALAPDGQGNGQPPDERTVRLGKTVRTLHERLPTLLATPLPQEILSPAISLHLFPSTHPHLPTVTGRISYTAALWTAPVAWGCVPVLGNVRLKIESERMVGHGVWNPAVALDGAARGFDNGGNGYRNEKLIVRWKTCRGDRVGKNPSAMDKISQLLGRDVAKDEEEFSGLFIFEFDKEGRLGRHTIEHAQQGGNWEKMTRVVSVTDWLIGLAKGRGRAQEGLALGSVRVPVNVEDEAIETQRARRLRELGR